MIILSTNGKPLLELPGPLEGADLSHDILGGSTELQETDLSHALLAKPRFDGARYSEGTRFPEGFNPLAAGMVLVR